MVEIKFVVQQDNIQRVIEAMKKLYPIPTVNQGTKEEPNEQPEFTDTQWAKEAIRRLIIREVTRHEQKKAQDMAMSEVIVNDDLVE